MKKLLLIFLFFVISVCSVQAQTVVISEIYGAGGNAGAVFTNDFIELYNPTNASINLTGWSVQYASAAGTSWATIPLNTSIAAHGFYLVQGSGGANGAALPAADASGTINMSATTGKVALVSTLTALSGASPVSPTIVDLVGFGGATFYEGAVAPSPSSTTSIERKAKITSTTTTMTAGGIDEFLGNGYDSNNNAQDFVTGAPRPQNTASPAESAVTAPIPSISVNPTSLTFTAQLINTTSASQQYNLSAANLDGSDVTVTVSGPYTISKTSGGAFGSSLTFSSADFGNFPLSIYVQFKPIVTGAATGTITHAGGGVASGPTVSLTGTGIAEQLTASTASIDFGSQDINTNSASKPYILSGTNLSGDVNVTVPAPFSVSRDNTSFTNSITYGASEFSSPQTVYVRFSPASTGNASGVVSNTSVNVANIDIPLTGIGTSSAPAPKIVISELYGGGGNSGAVYKNDFIELYNPTTSAVDLTGWSVQYTSAAGTGNWTVTPLSGTIASKGYFLIQEAKGTGGTTDLPTPDITGTIAMAGTAGKVILSNSTVVLSGANPTGNSIVDKVGFGPTATGFEGTAPTAVLTNTTSAERKANAASTAASMAFGGADELLGNGYDTDDNASDFVISQPNPQNSSLAEPPAPSNNPVLTASSTNLTFVQAVNTTSLSQKYTLSAANLAGPVSLSTTAPFSISKDNANFSTTAEFTAAELATTQTVYIHFSPTVAGTNTGTISHTSANASQLILNLVGTGIDPNQTKFAFENCSTSGSSALSDGFYQYSVTGAQKWGCITTFGHDANDASGSGSAGNALQINGYSGGNVQNEDWLISPPLLISSFTYPILSYWTRSAFNGDKLQLKVSTNYSGSGDPKNATWTDVNGKFPEPASDIWTKTDNIDLSAFKSSPVYVAFVYNSSTTSASRWTVDDFSVRNSSTPAAVEIITSTGSVNFAYQAPETSSAALPINFSASNLTADVTVSAPQYFGISKTIDGVYGNSLSYPAAEINNTSQSFYAKFNPVAADKNYTGSLTFSTSGTANKSISFYGNTFNVDNSLEVVNWNIEWFGSPAQDPSNDQLQATNVSTVVNSLKADIYGFAEVVDTTLFKTKVMPAGYQVVFSDFGSYADDKNDPDYALSQKLAFMYKPEIIKPLEVFGILRNTYYPSNLSNSTDGSPFKNWSSGRFPFVMKAQVTLNGKQDTVYFIEIHAKANTGTTAEQIDSYNRRKGGARQLKDWLDANLAGKKVLIIGDFNDVLDPDKTIAPLPAGTGTSYSDFTNDTAKYVPLTLPLSLAGKQSTAGFKTVIDNAIASKSLNVNYIPGSAEVLDNVKNLVASYSTTTTDHYPIKTRYILSNSAPTINRVADQSVCYSSNPQTIELSGISAGNDANQAVSLSVTASNNAAFDVLTVQPVSSGKSVLTYHFKNNSSATSLITVTVRDNGGTDFGGIDTKTISLKLTEVPLAQVNIVADATTVSKGGIVKLSVQQQAGQTYQWTGADIQSGQGTNQLVIRPKETGTYKITATNSLGCTVEASISITVVKDHKFDITNVLTPNGDGRNDFFVIKNIDYYPENTVKIFDRAGRLLYSQKGYNNTWDGTYNGSPLAEGTYYYIIDMGANVGIFRGYINIIRD
ncbi:T9SS type B sorting domain-containing protein [Pedobacter sp. HMF7647]|uniref:T9SS type B sorting domain-containing protein n=1 Tax=Hufsiella arboris TaxID=2695275 RepID=A0A7K1YD90_9SPHI|nr:lamin tail domain-containing protein [Hufsiella arboris]MXV52553.1 T9SS type B sorting domain-containing protein [Hufsiella arboris]